MAIESLHLPIEGMTCDNCARSVERTLSAIPGVTKVNVDLRLSAANVEYDPGFVARDVLVNAVRDLGYEVPA
jgi:copper chaperone CopZ